MATKKSNNKEVKKENKLISFFKGAKSELKKVSWPTKKELVNYTVVVLVVVALMTVLIWGLDFMFKGLLGIFV
ncbi:MAG: preprotein translocase subunit SecE [Tissierellales bacterium]|jgi:preprotein translocase subunit SecE|nr:preprotein translocase subunit SecE [Tissierellales bacterium]HCX04632.1 preprotein translocase subunit SecE [Clostridiales bacterium]